MTKRVLVIEDEPNIIEAVSFILSRDGWEVKTHANGHDAMDAVRARAPDLIILDVMLPGKSGFDILQEIRADAVYGDTPVLMFLARRTYRLRRLSDAARMLPIAGAVLFSVPLLWETEGVRTTRAMFYIFGLWIVLAVIAGVISARLRPTDTEEDPKGSQER